MGLGWGLFALGLDWVGVVFVLGLGCDRLDFIGLGWGNRVVWSWVWLCLG